MAVYNWFGNLFQSLTVLGVVIFIISFVIFLFSAAVYLLRNNGDRYAWFMVGMVAIFLGGGLSFGMAKAVELLSQGVDDSLEFVPAIQESVGRAFDMGASPWLNGAVPDATPTLTITESEVTILATSGVPISPTPEPSATPTLGSGVGGPAETPDTTLTDDEIAATAIVIQQQQATFTPRPPTAVPTLDMSVWNPQTPAPTPNPGG